MNDNANMHEYDAEGRQTTKAAGKRKRHLSGMLGLVVGLAAAASVGHWPLQAAPIQMALYTALVFGPLLLGMWPDRDRRGFLTGLSLMFLLHAILLYFIRSAFPFRTILVIIPMVVIEGIIMFVLMLKILGDG